jgi:hypothetical protein
VLTRTDGVLGKGHSGLKAWRACLRQVRTIQGDFLSLLDTLEQDVVFLDPPWVSGAYSNSSRALGGPGEMFSFVRPACLQGGKEYGKDEKLDLFLGGVPLAEVCERLKPRTRCIALKLPMNFNLDGESPASAIFFKYWRDMGDQWDVWMLSCEASVTRSLRILPASTRRPRGRPCWLFWIAPRTGMVGVGPSGRARVKTRWEQSQNVRRLRELVVLKTLPSVFLYAGPANRAAHQALTGDGVDKSWSRMAWALDCLGVGAGRRSGPSQHCESGHVLVSVLLLYGDRSLSRRGKSVSINKNALSHGAPRLAQRQLSLVFVNLQASAFSA